MDNAQAADLTDRIVLQAQCQELRSELKTWEQKFADANGGKKPSRGDIKQDKDIAAKYKTYNRSRNVLDGKRESRSAQEKKPSDSRQSKPSHSKSLKPGAKTRPATIPIEPLQTPRKSQRLPSQTLPSVLDPSEDPATTSTPPHPFIFKTSIGPTPDRNGKVLGLFDLLSSGGTPSTRKRKATYLDAHDVHVAQTPTKRNKTGDLLDHLGSASRGRHHSRTPASEGKKFFLSQFFATPTTTRFATITEDQEPCVEPEVVSTPLRTTAPDESRGGRHEDAEKGPDETPAFLKRTTSFNHRLQNAMNPKRNGNPTAPPRDFTSPEAIRKGPRMRTVKGKGLTDFLRGLQERNDEEAAEEADEEGLEALREIENNDTTTQPATNTPIVATEQPQRVWKKKGQKRTTRRVIMRPSARLHSTNADEHNVPNDSDPEFTGASKTRSKAPQDVPAEEQHEKENLPPSPSSSAYGSDSLSIPSDLDDFDELAPQPKPRVGKSKPNTKTQDAKNVPVSTTKNTVKPPAKKGKGRSINPNATAHMNFRTLKIRNRGSKGKGGGRFGGKRR